MKKNREADDICGIRAVCGKFLREQVERCVSALMALGVKQKTTN